MDREYVRSIRHAFANSYNLARFMGVSRAAVESWCTGRRVPGDVEQRMLHVLGVLMLDAPDLFDTLTGRARIGPLPAVPTVPPRVKAPTKAWGDSYWEIRTVTREEADAGDWPLVEDAGDVLNHLTEAQEREYWASLKAYETRTGRVKPE